MSHAELPHATKNNTNKILSMSYSREMNVQKLFTCNLFKIIFNLIPSIILVSTPLNSLKILN